MRAATKPPESHGLGGFDVSGRTERTGKTVFPCSLKFLYRY
jgi:hypothetical protein